MHPLAEGARRTRRHRISTVQEGPMEMAQSGDPQLETGRVLVADDDEDLRALLAVHLRKRGYNVVEFADGEGLLDYVGTLMRNPRQILPDDQVVLDVKMPGL